MTWAIFPGEKHLNAVIEIMSSASDRVAVVVGGALLDEAVSRTLTERLRDEAEVVDNILGMDRPLGNVGPKIDMLYLLHAIDSDARKALKGINRIRNFFAHKLDASFDSSDGEFVKALNPLTLHENKTHYPDHRYGPDTPLQIEKIKTNRDRFLVNLKLGLISLMRDRLSVR